MTKMVGQFIEAVRILEMVQRQSHADEFKSLSSLKVSVLFCEGGPIKIGVQVSPFWRFPISSPEQLPGQNDHIIGSTQWEKITDTVLLRPSVHITHHT